MEAPEDVGRVSRCRVDGAMVSGSGGGGGGGRRRVVLFARVFILFGPVDLGNRLLCTILDSSFGFQRFLGTIGTPWSQQYCHTVPVTVVGVGSMLTV